MASDDKNTVHAGTSKTGPARGVAGCEPAERVRAPVHASSAGRQGVFDDAGLDPGGHDAARA